MIEYAVWKYLFILLISRKIIFKLKNIRLMRKKVLLFIK